MPWPTCVWKPRDHGGQSRCRSRRLASGFFRRTHSASSRALLSSTASGSRWLRVNWPPITTSSSSRPNTASGRFFVGRMPHNARRDVRPRSPLTRDRAAPLSSCGTRVPIVPPARSQVGAVPPISATTRARTSARSDSGIAMPATKRMARTSDSARSAEIASHFASQTAATPGFSR